MHTRGKRYTKWIQLWPPVAGRREDTCGWESKVTVSHEGWRTGGYPPLWGGSWEPWNKSWRGTCPICLVIPPASRASAPLVVEMLQDQGLCPWTSLGAPLPNPNYSPPPNPHYRRARSARHAWFTVPPPLGSYLYHWSCMTMNNCYSTLGQWQYTDSKLNQSLPTSKRLLKVLIRFQ